MTTMSNRILFIAAALILSCLYATPANAQRFNPTHQGNRAHLNEIIPPPAFPLFRMPEASVLSGPNRLGPDAMKREPASRDFFDWTSKTLSPAWRPDEDAKPNLILIDSEFETRDTARLAYEKNGFRIELSQTAKIFAIKLTPMAGKTLGKGTSEKIEAARRLCMEIFNPVGKRWTGQVVDVPIPDLSKKIASYSFHPELVHELPGDAAIWGRPTTKEEEGVRAPQTDAEASRDNRPDNPDWDRVAIAWMYWFRGVYWWNDGQSVGFYFLKTEAGPWMASYYDTSLDAGWFLHGRDAIQWRSNKKNKNH